MSADYVKSVYGAKIPYEEAVIPFGRGDKVSLGDFVSDESYEMLEDAKVDPNELKSYLSKVAGKRITYCTRQSGVEPKVWKRFMGVVKAGRIMQVDSPGCQRCPPGRQDEFEIPHPDWHYAMVCTVEYFATRCPEATRERSASRDTQIDVAARRSRANSRGGRGRGRSMIDVDQEDDEETRQLARELATEERKAAIRKSIAEAKAQGRGSDDERPDKFRRTEGDKHSLADEQRDQVLLMIAKRLSVLDSHKEKARDESEGTELSELKRMLTLLDMDGPLTESDDESSCAKSMARRAKKAKRVSRKNAHLFAAKAMEIDSTEIDGLWRAEDTTFCSRRVAVLREDTAILDVVRDIVVAATKALIALREQSTDIAKRQLCVAIDTASFLWFAQSTMAIADDEARGEVLEWLVRDRDEQMTKARTRAEMVYSPVTAASRVQTKKNSCFSHRLPRQAPAAAGRRRRTGSARNRNARGASAQSRKQAGQQGKKSEE